jgi:uncharacterized protein YciI
MALFALTCLDKPNSLQVRLGARQAHLAWVGGTGMLKLGGPFLNEAGEMAGSLMIIEAEDLAAATAFNANDPYTRAGLWASVDIRPFRVTFGPL